MIQLKPTQLYAVQVPDDATEIEIICEGEYDENFLIYWSHETNHSEPLQSEFELIGTYQSGKIDFDAGEYLPQYSREFSYFKHFPTDTWACLNASDSLTSLLEANQVPIKDNEKWVILKLK